MSVLIPGMEMPKGCASCKISRRNGKKMICPFIWKCEWDIHDPMSADHRLDGCPLVPVPEHGDLIDRDALMKILSKVIDINASIEQRNEATDQERRCLWWFEQQIGIAPTIIPADKEGA